MDELQQPLIRRIEQKDFEAVAEMTRRHFPQMDMTASKIARRLSKGFYYFVATVEGSVVGFVDIRLREGKAKLMGLVVEEGFQGRGVGSALLNKALEFARTQGKNSVYLEVKQSNIRAIKVYETQGFVFSKERGESGESIYIMSRKVET